MDKLTEAMTELELQKDVLVKLAAATGGSAETAVPVSGSGAVTGRPHKPTNEQAYLVAALEDSERLLKYAAERGIDVDEDTRNGILHARSTMGTGWDEETAARLLVALTKLAAQLKPVSAESLGSFNTKPTVRLYSIVSICLALCIVLFSTASFVFSGISQSITAEIGKTNDLVLQLNADIAPLTDQTSTNTPPAASASGEGAISLARGVSVADVHTKLQALASAVRDIHDHAVQLNRFVYDNVADLHPSESKNRSYYELKVPLPTEPKALSQMIVLWIQNYQDARAFGNDVVVEVSLLYGAITYGILPVFYALLGTCAYLLRSFAQDMFNRTFVPSHSNSPRFLIAGIGGAVVGLFNNFTASQTPSISPLAIAFLVGYAVDVFFSFLEGLTAAFTKRNVGRPT